MSYHTVALDPERTIVSHYNDTTHIAFQLGQTVGLFDFGYYGAQYLHPDMAGLQSDISLQLASPASLLPSRLGGTTVVMSGWLNLTHIPTCRDKKLQALLGAPPIAQ